MIQYFLRRFLLFVVIGCIISLPFCGPAFATVYSFKSPGMPGEEGVLSGSISYDPDIVRQFLEQGLDANRGVSGSIQLEELGDNSAFSFEYISPHSGVRHSEETICGRRIYDLNNGLPGNEVIGGKDGPFFDFNDYYDLVSIDFRSCVGNKGDVYSSISDRDKEIAYSELESQFNQLKLIEEDYGGGKPGRFRKKLPLQLKLEEL